MNPNIFKTERLTIRNLILSDIDNFIDLQSNSKVMQFVGSPAMTVQECEDDLQKLIRLYTEPGNGFCVWGVYFNSEMIGTCAIIQNEDGNEIGYRFRERFWKQGFGNELTAGLVKFAFEDLNLKDLWAEADVSNLGSVKLLDRHMKRTEKVWNETDNCWDYKYQLSKEDYDKIRH